MMSYLHKEKERLRHQKQVKLLNKVIEYVPKTTNEPQTKVRKLRRLVLYMHYLRMIHSKLAKQLCPGVTLDDGKVKNTAAKPFSEPIKEPCQPKRKSRAHIVFLQADKPNCTNNAIKNHTLTNKDVETLSNDQESTTVPPSNYVKEYKVPDVVAIDSRVVFFNQEGTFTSEDVNHMQLTNDYSISSDNCQISPKSIISNNEKACSDLESNLSLKDFFYKEKENCQLIVADSAALNSNEKEFNEEYSLFDVEQFAHSIVINDENLRASKHKLDNFHTYLPSDYGNYILKDLEFSNIKNKNFKVSQLSSPDKDKEYSLNSYGSDSFQNVAGDYGFLSLPAKHSQNSVSHHNSLYVPGLNSTFKQPVYVDQSSITENASDYSSSSTSTDKINLGSEIFSDSNPSFYNFSDSSNSAQCNFYDSYANSICNDNSCVTKNNSYPINRGIKSEPMEIDSNALPMFHPSNHYFGSNVLMNEASFRHMYDVNLPYFGGNYPSSINFNGNSNCLAAYQPDSIHALYNRTFESKTQKDFDSLYTPSLYDSVHSEEFSLLQPKSELTNFNYPSEPFTRESIKPAPFFEEEISYPLSQYLENC